jgi:hypothetical protein
LGVGCFCQVEPSHLSAKVTVIPDVLRCCPTAVHASGDEHETDSSCPPDRVAFGDSSIVQVVLAASAPLPAKITNVPSAPDAE